MSAFLRDALLAHVAQFGLADADVLCRTPRGVLFRRDYYNREIWKMVRLWSSGTAEQRVMRLVMPLSLVGGRSGRLHT
jgi:hypothetical protein